MADPGSSLAPEYSETVPELPESRETPPVPSEPESIPDPLPEANEAEPSSQTPEPSSPRVRSMPEAPLTPVEPEPQPDTAPAIPLPEPVVPGERSPAQNMPDGAAPAQEPAAPAADSHMARGQEAEGISSDEVALHLLGMVNKEREGAGLAALGLEESLHWAASIRAPELMDDFSHTRPDGTPYYTAFDEAGFPYVGKWHGENVAYLQFPAGTYDAYGTAKKLFEGLKNSPGHYQNMLGENFSQAGIGVFVKSDATSTEVASVQLFSSF